MLRKVKVRDLTSIYVTVSTLHTPNLLEIPWIIPENSLLFSLAHCDGVSDSGPDFL